MLNPLPTILFFILAAIGWFVLGPAIANPASFGFYAAWLILSAILSSALRMASRHPAAFLRLDDELGAIAPGMRASLVALDESLRAVRVWIDGVEEEDG